MGFRRWEQSGSQKANRDKAPWRAQDKAVHRLALMIPDKITRMQVCHSVLGMLTDFPFLHEVEQMPRGADRRESDSLRAGYLIDKQDLLDGGL